MNLGIGKISIILLIGLMSFTLLPEKKIAKDNSQHLIVSPETATQNGITLLWDKPGEV